VSLVWYALAAGLIRIADNSVGVSVVVLALQRTNSPGAAGLIVTGYTLPALVSGPLLGAWLDRTRHRKLALIGNQLVLAVTMLALVSTLGHAPLPVCLAIVAAAGVTLPLTSAGFTSLIPYLVPAARLPRANMLDAITFNGAALVGPAIAGTVAAAVSPAWATIATAVIAAAAVPATMLLRTPSRADHSAATSLWATVVAGTRVMLRTPPLRGGTLTTAISMLAQGMFAVGFPLFAVELGATAAAGGAFWGALEVGSLLGAFAATWLLSRLSPERLIMYFTAIFGVAIATWPLARSLPPAAILVAIGGVVSGPLLVATFSMRQRYAPRNLLAQVSTAGASMKIGSYALGAAAGGWLVPVTGARWGLVAVAVLHVVAALAGYAAARGPALADGVSDGPAPVPALADAPADAPAVA
jgi:MFS family permease